MNINRYKELDSLRGIAALTVVFSHFLNIYNSIPNFIKHGPFRFFVASREAVIFFFVLSGFVLALPYLKKPSPTYTTFLRKRIFRIYIPYLFALFIAILMDYLVSKGGINELSFWFNGIWTQPISLKLVINHLFLIDSFKNAELNPVLWSLVYEMRISIIFPLIILVIRYKWWISILLGLSFSTTSAIVHYYLIHYTTYNFDYFDTFHYIFMFIIGAILAKNREVLVVKIKLLSIRRRYILFIFGFTCYTYLKVSWLIKDKDTFLKSIPNDWITSIGVSIFIIFALSSRSFSRILLNKMLLFIGEISYSLYLYHAIILLTMINLLFGKVNINIILLGAFILSIVVSYIGWRIIEKPSMVLNRKITKGLNPHVNFLETNIK